MAERRDVAAISRDPGRVSDWGSGRPGWRQQRRGGVLVDYNLNAGQRADLVRTLKRVPACNGNVFAAARQLCMRSITPRDRNATMEQALGPTLPGAEHRLNPGLALYV